MATTTARTVYRADHPGSYIRPEGLRRARIDHAHGRLTDEQLRHVEDEAILHVLGLQRAVGMDVLTDGEFRRKFFMTGPLKTLTGVEDRSTPNFERYPRLRDVDPELLAEVTTPHVVVLSKLVLQEHFTAEEVAFMKQHARTPFKITLPSPITLGNQGWYQPGITDQVYPTESEMWQDIANLLAEEAEWLVDQGVPYLQVDAPGYTRFMVPERRALLADPEREFQEIVGWENTILRRARAPGVTTAVHICLGTFWLGDPSPGGGFDPVQYDPEWTGRLFTELEADVFQVEYTGRASAGALQALRDVPKGKIVSLGVINIRDPQLESQDELLRKVEEAGQVFPMENLSLIANCGYAGNNAGAFMDEDQQKRKMELLVDTVRKIWG